MKNNLIERIVGMLPPGVKLSIRDGSIGNIRQTVIELNTNERKLSCGIKIPYTDDDFYLKFIDTLTVWKS